jgi:hypothetical protein
MTSRSRTSCQDPSSAGNDVRCARWPRTACPSVCECVGTLCRVLGAFIETEVVRRQVTPFSSAGRWAADPQTRRGAGSDQRRCSAAGNHSHTSRHAGSDFLRARSSIRRCAADFERRVCVSAGAVVRRAVRMAPFRANAWPGAPKLSPSSPNTLGESVHHVRPNAHREPLRRRCSSALGAWQALKRSLGGILRWKHTLAT